MTSKTETLNLRISQLTLSCTIFSVLFYILEAFGNFFAMDRGGIYFFLPIIYLAFAILQIVTYIICKKNEVTEKTLIIFFATIIIFRLFSSQTALSLLIGLFNLLLTILHAISNKNTPLKIIETLLIALTLFLSVIAPQDFLLFDYIFSNAFLMIAPTIHALIYGFALIINILSIAKYHSSENEFIENENQVEQLQANSDTTIEDLKALKELLDCGAITQEEFDKKKIEILNII